MTSDFGTKSREEREKCNGIVYISLLSRLYGDTGRVIGFDF